MCTTTGTTCLELSKCIFLSFLVLVCILLLLYTHWAVVQRFLVDY